MIKNKVLKNTKVRILIIVEVIILLIGIIGVARGNRIAITDQEMNISILAGEYIEEKGYLIDQTYDYEGTYLLSDKFELSPGVYELLVYYTKTGEDTASTKILNNSSTFYGYRSSISTLFLGENINKSQFYVVNKSDSFQVAVNTLGTDEMIVSAIEVVHTNAGSKLLLFCVILLSFLVNGLVWFYFYQQENEVPREIKVAWIAVPGIAILASIPLLTDYTIVGTDTLFYLKRIEIIAYQISMGDWSFKSIFLTIPALFRLIGFPMLFAYGMFIFVINLISATTAYLCTKKSFENTYIAILGSAIYTLVPYRISLIYGGGDIGTLVELLLLPFFVFLLLKLFQKDNRKYVFATFILTIIVIGGYILNYYNGAGVSTFLTEEMSKIIQISRMESWDTIKGIGVPLFVGCAIFLLVCFLQKKEKFLLKKEICITGMISFAIGLFSILLNFRLLAVACFTVPALMGMGLLLTYHGKRELVIYITTILGMFVIFALYQTNSILLATSNEDFVRGYTLDTLQTKEQVVNWYAHPIFFQSGFILCILSIIAVGIVLTRILSKKIKSERK